MTYFLSDDEKNEFKQGLKVRIFAALTACDTIPVTGTSNEIISAIRYKISEELSSKITEELLQNLTIIVPANTVIKLKTSTGSVTAFTITEDVTAARVKID